MTYAALRLWTLLSATSATSAALGFFKACIGYILLTLPPNYLICSAAGLISFSVYSLDKIGDLDEDAINSPHRAATLRGREKLAVSAALGSYVLALVLAWLATPAAAVLCLVPLFALGLYSRIKPIPPFKGPWVAASWATIVALVPAVEGGVQPSVALGVWWFMFVATFVDCTLYDVRDVEGDKSNGIRTVPVILGTEKTTALLLAASVAMIPWRRSWSSTSSLWSSSSGARPLGSSTYSSRANGCSRRWRGECGGWLWDF